MVDNCTFHINKNAPNKSTVIPIRTRIIVLSPLLLHDIKDPR